MTSADALVNIYTGPQPLLESLPSSRSPLERESRASDASRRNMALEVTIV